jgi:hypothetical protein
MRKFNIVILFALSSFTFALHGTTPVKKSLIFWDKVIVSDWTNLGKWKRDRVIKDQTPDWQQQLRLKYHYESMGRVLDSVGEVRHYRGTGYSKTNSTSEILEGDDIKTEKGGHCWIYLLDGSLVRLAPETSVTFREFNITPTEVFIFMRVNAGNVVYLSRNQKQFKESHLFETDTMFFPLDVTSANGPLLPKDYDEDNLEASLLDHESSKMQFKTLNTVIKKNNKLLVAPKKAKIFIGLPNGDILGEDISMEFIVLLGGKSFIKQRSVAHLGLSAVDSEEGESETSPINFYFRGYENRETRELLEDIWYEVSSNGREITESEKSQKRFALGEWVTKRIPSIYIAREKFFSKYSRFIYEKVLKKDELGSVLGHRLWGSLDDPKSDMTRRLLFLKEYNRRQETTNLLAARKLNQKYIKRGEKYKSVTYSDIYYKQSIENFYKRLQGAPRRHLDPEVINSTSRKFWEYIHEYKK